ncbi:MAG: hypothetical protein O2807_08775, partial [bacterium]|nr:hypothetical protein [bacterium]
MAAPTPQPTGSFLQFFKDWGILIVAVVALAQPWIISVFNKYFRQGRIDIYETGSIEIGYSTYGPTIGLIGTLRSFNQDLFVENMNITIKRISDNAQHEFTWALFRQLRLSYSGQKEGGLEATHGFMISTSQPKPFNILFYELTLLDNLRPHAERISAEWSNHVLQTIQGGAQPGDSNFFITQFLTFSALPVYTEIRTEIDRQCYWEEGDYSLVLRARTAKPTMDFTREWTFHLTETESRNLRANSARIIIDAASIPLGL